VTTPAYLRCTLRLAPEDDGCGGDQETIVQHHDDWSRGAAYDRRPDPAVLDYVHSGAVALVRSLQPAGWQEEDGGDTLIFWLEEEAAVEESVRAGLAALDRLGHLDIEPESPGWDGAWREFHRPHAVGRVYLRPPWLPARADLLDVAVDAGQAFGTGAHATTRQCVAALQELTPRAMLDLGCGSGVVSLAAIRLGFAPVRGVDIDPVAVAAARENAARNGLTPEFLVADATDTAVALPASDTVVANIALGPILRLAVRFRVGEPGSAPQLRPAHLLLAGLLVEQGDEALAAFPDHRVRSRLEEDGWLLLHLVPR
jgi:ribosomal protein L11 methyltransferase